MAPRLATSLFANIFGNGTIYRHDKKLKRAKAPEINRINRELRSTTHKSRCNSGFGPPADLVPLNYILADLVPRPKCRFCLNIF